VGTYFTAPPDYVVNEDLVPAQTHVALVVVSGDLVPVDVVPKQVDRRCSDGPNWKWETVAHGDKKFLITVPTFDDLDRVGGIWVVVPGFSSTISIFASQSSEVPHKLESGRYGCMSRV
jgi:hypothetical protein